MTLILFLCLGISNKSIPSEGLIKGLCGELYAAGLKSGYGRRAVWLNNSCFLSAKLAVFFGKSKNQHYARFTRALCLWMSVCLFCVSDYQRTWLSTRLHVWTWSIKTLMHYFWLQNNIIKGCPLMCHIGISSSLEENKQTRHFTENKVKIQNIYLLLSMYF